MESRAERRVAGWGVGDCSSPCLVLGIVIEMNGVEERRAGSGERSRVESGGVGCRRLQQHLAC